MHRAERSPIAEHEAHAARVHVVDPDSAIFQSIAPHASSNGMIPMAHRDAEEFRARFSSDTLSCVVLDVSAQDRRGLTLLREIRTHSPDTPVIMVTENADVSCVLEAMRLGAVDFLEKPLYAEELFDRILRALEHGRAERQKHNRRAEVLERVDRLTPREFEVMTLLRKGRTVKEIAYEFGLSHKTVQVHRARVLKRMSVDSVVLLTNLLNDLDIDLSELLTPAAAAQ